MNDLLELGGSQLGDALFLVYQYPGLVGFIESINKSLKVLLFLSFSLILITPVMDGLYKVAVSQRSK